MATPAPPSSAKSDDPSNVLALGGIGSVFSILDVSSMTPSVSSVTKYIPPIPSALNPQTLLFGPASSETSLQAMLTTSFTVMKRSSALTGVSLLLRCGIDMFYDFLCNHIAGKVMRERLALVAWILGDPWYGMVPFSESTSKPLPKEKITELEELLSAGLRYFSRYTRADDHFSFLLLGVLPVEMFASFDTNITRIVNEIVTLLGASEDIKMQPSPRYYVVCDILTSIRELEKKQMMNENRRSKGLPIESDAWFDFVNKLAAERGFTVTESAKIECAREVEEIRKYVAAYTQESTRLVKNKPQDIIRQKALRTFWLNEVGDTLLCPLSQFQQLMQDALIAQGAERQMASEFSSTLFNSLKADCVPETDRQVDPFALAKLSRYISPDEMNLVKVVKLIVDNLALGFKMLLPSFDLDCQVFFDPNQDTKIAGVVAGKEKWTGISGPKLSGKSHRLLYAVHSFPKLKKDFLWVDFTGIDKDVDGFSRITQQFFFRNCHRVADLHAQLRDLFSSVKEGTVVIFDNLVVKTEDTPGDGGDKPWRKWLAFLSQLFSLCKEFEDKIRFVIVTESLEPFRDVIWFSDEVVIPPLTQQTAMIMASTLKPNLKVSSFVPVDPIALQVASTSLPGEIAALAHACPIGTLRKISRSVAAAGTSVENLKLAKVVAAEAVFANLDGDEKLLTSCLFSDLPPFDESLSWALAKRLFDEDIVRWRVAWNGLIEVGWVTFNPDLGFVISYLPSLIPGGSAAELPQDLWDIYVSHWVDELVRIIQGAEECRSVLEAFRHNLPHFRHVFESFITQPNQGGDNLKTPGQRSISAATLKAIARKLAGSAGPLLNYCFTATSGVIVANSIKRELEGATTPADQLSYQKACIELAEQQFRNLDYVAALAVMSDVVRPFYPINKLDPVPDGDIVDAKALVLYGRLLDITKKKPVEVVMAYNKAMDIYRKKNLTVINNKDCAYAGRLLDAVTGGSADLSAPAATGCGCTIM